jgi:glycerol uptake facilitator-like aquaporin
MLSKVISEFLGTAFLLAIVVGSGIMGENLSQGNAAIALLANSLATGAGLFVLIQSLGPLSGAHFNPVVSLVELFWGRLKPKDFIAYIMAQILGALAGVLITHLMFNLPLIQVSHKVRNGSHLWLSEFVATFGLISVIALVGKRRVEWAPATIAAYITSAYWFTSSTSFANPAVTIARAWTDTFCGIAPSGVSSFIVAQIFGAGIAFLLLRGLPRQEPIRVES